MFYLARTPWWLRALYRHCTWSMPGSGKHIYLSFDDGPHPEITPFVLDELKKYGAMATFFCIGKNVQAFPDIYKRIIAEGHTVGNHSFNHLNGWNTKNEEYLEDIAKAGIYIESNLFRPPYGKITWYQQQQLSKPRFRLQTVMWSVLSGDFDIGITPSKCLDNVLKNTKAGSIVVFHDSEKAADRMRYALTGTLEHFRNKGFEFKKIEWKDDLKKSGPG